MTEAPKRVAIIGGGITGSCAANHLQSLLNESTNVEIVFFDQGGRGPGGRASHRRVRRCDSVVLPDDLQLQLSETSDAFQFDHGCQFFCALDDRFLDKVGDWQTAGVAKEWGRKCAFVTNFNCVEGFHNVDHDSEKAAKAGGNDFFGILSCNKCYVGAGGMHKLSRFEANSAVKQGAVLKSGVRVSKIQPIAPHSGSPVPPKTTPCKIPNNVTGPREESLLTRKWELYGTGGMAALHDTAESIAASAVHHSLGSFDAVIVTDASCSFEGWHRASAGISAVKPEFGAFIRSRARIPLFTAMVAFDRKMFDGVDSAVFDQCEMNEGLGSGPGNTGDSISHNSVWFAARCSSKPGMESPESFDCWTLVSSPMFAVYEISSTTMQDEVGTEGNLGVKKTVFKPQENSYLNEGPALTMVNTFLYRMEKYLQKRRNKDDSNSEDKCEDGTPTDTEGNSSKLQRPEILFLQGQRWGSAVPGDFLPPDLDLTKSTKFVNVEGVIYQREIPELRLRHDNIRCLMSDLNIRNSEENDIIKDGIAEKELKNFLHDDDLGLFYAGDFCSHRAAGVEAAYLSGIDVADHVFNLLN